MSDQFDPGYRMLVVACKSDKRWFDLDAVRTEWKLTHSDGTPRDSRGPDANGESPRHPRQMKGRVGTDGENNPSASGNNPAGAPPLDYWLIDESEPLTTEGTNMGEARYIIGDVFDALATLEDNSVDLVFSSPPFLALRSYLPADHSDKAKEIGSEATPADFLDTLLDVVEACDRVLAPHGSLVFELGDTFAGSGGAGGDYAEGGLRDGQEKFTGSASKHQRVEGRTEWERAHPITNSHGPSGGGGNGWPLPKSLCGIPTLFAWSLAYGRNLLRPERETPRWRIRNLIVWARPNPPVGALGDKFRPATSYLTVACKSDKRWFDLDAVRTPHQEASRLRGTPRMKNHSAENAHTGWNHDDPEREQNPAGAPPLDYWEIPTHPFPGSHYATFPPALCIKPIKSMCPERVCKICGEPSRRITGDTTYRTDDSHTSHVDRFNETERAGPGVNSFASPGGNTGCIADRETLGWTDCNHDDWRAGCVLDPFAGSGTTLAVATGHGRDAIGIDLDARNFELARERVGPMFLPEPEFVGEPFQFPKVEDVQTDAEVL